MNFNPQYADDIVLFLGFVLYPILAWATLSVLRGKPGEIGFGLLNLVAAFAITIFYAPESSNKFKLIVFSVYVSIILASYGLLLWSKRKGADWSVAPLVFPILFMVAVRFVPDQFVAAGQKPGASLQAGMAPFFVGISYLTFRLSHLAQEVHNDVAELPPLSRYLSFAFFAPTLILGPISPYSAFSESLSQRSTTRPDVPACLFRMLVGLVKYLFISTLLNQLSFKGLILDGHLHSWFDFLLAALVFPMYLYCNFSGFCDLAIGAAGLIGIEIHENFDRPFSARNIQEFWNRWHMTLSRWFRDILFTPMVKVLGRRFGPKSIQSVTAVSIVISFVLIGIWHGSGLNFFLFGLMQGIGVATVFLWTMYLKRRLGAKRFNVVRDHPWIRLVSVGTTYCFFAASLVLWANPMDQLVKVFEVVR
jgi:D-alanyl-lipoteichoic acid acyltransferase DltB (MBOAT superfamily)